MKDGTVRRLQFILVDQNPARAAAIFAALLRHGRGVSVTESFDEAPRQLDTRRVVLAADGPGVIPDIMERVKQAGIDAKVIAYSEDASSHRIVKAMSAGAADYLPWPFDPDSLVAAADAATAAQSKAGAVG